MLLLRRAVGSKMSYAQVDVLERQSLVAVFVTTFAIVEAKQQRSQLQAPDAAMLFHVWALPPRLTINS